MPNPRLTAIITALLYLTVPGGANAAYTLGQLQDIEQYIVGKDCGGLLGYLLENPEIMDGSDPLATELRSFADGVGTGIIQCLSATPGLGTRGLARRDLALTRGPLIDSGASVRMQYEEYPTQHCLYN